jgi:hypothetical protein
LGGERSGGDRLGGDRLGEDGSGGDGSSKNRSIGDRSVRNWSVAKKLQRTFLLLTGLTMPSSPRLYSEAESSQIDSEKQSVLCVCGVFFGKCHPHRDSIQRQSQAR